MKLFDKKGIEAWHLLLGLVVVVFGIYFMSAGTGGDGPIIVRDPTSNADMDYVGPVSDGVCENIKSAYDPDCPLYCPPSRTGAFKICCVNDEGTAVIPCDDVVEIQQEQALVKFGSEADATTKHNIIMQVLAKTGAVTGVENYDLWINKWEIAPGNSEFQNSIDGCQDVNNNYGCIGTSHKHANVLPNTLKYWQSAVVNMNSVNPLGDESAHTYTLNVEVCGKDSAGKLQQICNSESYDITITNQIISFEVSADLQQG